MKKKIFKIPVAKPCNFVLGILEFLFFLSLACSKFNMWVYTVFPHYGENIGWPYNKKYKIF